MTKNGNKILIGVLAIIALLGIIGTFYFSTVNQEASVAKILEKNSVKPNISAGELVNSVEISTGDMLRKKSIYMLAFSDGNGGYTCHYYSLTKNELKNKKFDGNHVTQVACP